MVVRYLADGNKQSGHRKNLFLFCICPPDSDKSKTFFSFQTNYLTVQNQMYVLLFPELLQKSVLPPEMFPSVNQIHTSANSG